MSQKDMARVIDFANECVVVSFSKKDVVELDFVGKNFPFCKEHALKKEILDRVY